MRLPATSAANILLLDAGKKFVKINQFGTPGVLQVQSVLNRANEATIIQNTAAAQPTWSSNGLQATYAWRNNPGTTQATPPGQPAIMFASASSQYLEYDALATSFSGTETPFTIVSLYSCSTPSSGTNTIWSATASGSATPILSLHATGGNIVFTETSSGGTITATAATDTNAHVVTCTRTGTNITLRVDGAQVATTAIASPASQTYTAFCIGSQNFTSNTNFFNGAIHTVAAYLGVADIDEVEAYLLLRAGIQRGNVFNS